MKQDNTTYLIRTGIFTVLLPTAISLFAPLAFAAIWVFQSGEFLLWPLFLGMLAGMAFSYFTFFISSRFWLAWAIVRSNNLPKLKRKAFRNNLVTERGRALIGASHFHKQEKLKIFDAVDSTLSQEDDATVPERITLYNSTGNRVIAIAAICMFALAAIIILIMLPQRQWTAILKFTPLLLIGFIFLYKKESRQMILEIDKNGLRQPNRSWTWDQIGSLRYIEKNRAKQGSGRSSLHSRRIRNLSFETIDNKQYVIQLNQVPISFDIEEYIAVYRFRHSLQTKAAY